MSRKTSAYARKQALLANKPKSTLHPLMRFSPENESKLQYEPRMALEFFRCGKGAPEHHTTLVFRLNWGRHMATDLFDNADVVQVIVKAQNAVGGIKSRFDRLGAWAFPLRNSTQSALVWIWWTRCNCSPPEKSCGKPPTRQ